MTQASSSKIFKYDVFLSFRGEDTRKNIVSHLYNALQQRGIRTFKDDERLETGKPISYELLKAIEEARFAVVIFSKRYASSRWCLEELAHIIKCKNELEQIVIPIFYDVSPSDVRHQNPPFANSFSQHEEKYRDDMDKVQRWRDAFVEAGQLLGYHLLNLKDEAECIKKLVDDISPKSLQVMSTFPETLVGMKSQVEKVTSLLDMESNDVRSIGIWGMGGIGKTEIANILHQRYRHRFEADCFLDDVGKLHLKKGLQKVICKLLGEKLTVTSKHEGMNILKNRLRRKKVLFILDDINHQEQLEFLVGGPEWFGMGSRIILIARDKNLLTSHVGDVYEVQLLCEDEALELFSRHAFGEKSPKEDFMELSRQVVEHAGGLPLALKVLGSAFHGLPLALKVGEETFSRNCAITYLPSSLRIIDWPGYSSFSLPESFEPLQLVVLSLCGSQLVELWPMSKVGSHEKMRVNIVPFKHLIPDEPKVLTLDLLKNLKPDDVQNEKARGQLVLGVMYKAFNDEELANGADESNTVEKVPDGTPDGGGVLVVIVHEGQYLEGKHHTNPSVRMLFRGEERRTKVVKKNRDPRWEEEFWFVLEEPPVNDRIHVEVVSTSKRMGLRHPKETLGYVDVYLADVINNKRINERYHLIDSKNGRLQIELQWRTAS